MSILRGFNLRNQVAFFAQAPRKLRASKKMHPGGREERDPMFHRVIIPTKILEKEGSQNIAREICPHNGGEKADNARIAVKERQRKTRSDVMSCSSSATSFSDSSD